MPETGNQLRSNTMSYCVHAAIYGASAHSCHRTAHLEALLRLRFSCVYTGSHLSLPEVSFP